MKKVLLCTTALAATGIAGTADAVDIKNGALTVGVGGFINTTLAFTSIDTGSNLAAADFDGIDTFTDAEIIFTPSLELDNGIRIGANIQLEAGSGPESDQIDESYFFISGNFGEVNIGSENSAGYKLTVVAPDVSHIYAQSSSLTSFVPYSSSTAGAGLFRGTLGTTYIENAGNNDANRITYYTPNFNGLQLGISYARDSGQGNGPVDNNAIATGITDIIDIAANYGGSFVGLDVNASARYGTADSPVAGLDPEIWGAGLSLGFGGFTIGGSYAEQDGTALQDGRSYDVGIGYAPNGPWSYSLTYFDGENIDDETAVNREEFQQVTLAARYTFNPNFSVSAFLADINFEEPATPGDNIEATVVGVSAGFNF